MYQRTSGIASVANKYYWWTFTLLYINTLSRPESKQKLLKPWSLHIMAANNHITVLTQNKK